MRQILLKITVFAFSLLLIYACKEKSILTPKINVGMTQVVVSEQGQDVFIPFVIDNPVSGVSLSYSISEVQWISDLVVPQGEKGEISFKVAKNSDSSGRSASIVLSYQGAENVTIQVNQPDSSPAPFEIDVKESSYTSVKIDIFPQDKQMNYIFSFMEKKEGEESLSDDELFQAEMQFFENLAKEYGMSMDALMDYYLSQGDTTGVSLEYFPGKNIEIFAYGLKNDGGWTRTTDIVRVEASTQALPFIDATYDMEVEVNGPEASIKVTPSNDSPYFVSVYDAQEVENSGMSLDDFAMAKWIGTVNTYKYYGFSIEDIVKGLCVSGEYLFQPSNLKAQNRYIAGAFAVDPSTAYQNSSLSSKEFTTGSVKPSDNIIAIEVSDITAVTATLKFTTTNEDSYVAAVGPLDVMPETDDDILKYIIENVSLNIMKGDSEKKVQNLTPEREYGVWAFGYSGGVVTTELFSSIFKTKEKVVSSVVFKAGIPDYYSMSDIIAKDSSWSKFSEYDVFADVVVTVESGEVDKYYIGVFKTKNFDSSSTESYVNYLISLGANKQGNEAFYALNYGDEVVVLALIQDTDGNFSDLFVSDPIAITKEGVNSDTEGCLKRLEELYGKKSSEIEKNIVR